MIGGISTPPVALGAFTAATMAGTSPLKTGLEAMRLGGVIYIAPFFFVLNPALVGEGSAYDVVVTLLTALAGVWLIASALQGYVSLIGLLDEGPKGMAARGMLLTGGLFCAAPGGDWIGLPHLALAGIGLAIALLGLLMARRGGRTTAPARTMESHEG